MSKKEKSHLVSRSRHDDDDVGSVTQRFVDAQYDWKWTKGNEIDVIVHVSDVIL
jgi:hypothetical protein